MAMKINTINQIFFKNNPYSKNSKTDFNSSQTVSKPTVQISLSNNFYPPVNFKAAENSVFVNDLKDLENIHCPICGVKMLSNREKDRLIKEGMKIKSVKNFVKWLEKNRDNVPERYQHFVESAKRNSEEYATKDVDVLLKKMRDTAVIASNNTIDDMKNIIVDAQKKYNFTDSENVLLDECFVRLDEFDADDYANISKPLSTIMCETVGAIDKPDAKKIYTDLIVKLKPAAEFQKLFATDGPYKNVLYKKRVLQNVFGGSYSNVQKIITNFADDRGLNVNTILVCSDCTPPRASQLFKYHGKNENLEANLTKYLEDVAVHALDNNFGKNNKYPLELIKFTNKITNGKININLHDKPILKALNIKVFHEQQKKVDFEPLKHSGIPCASCGDMTVTHDEKVKLYKEIEQTKDLKELLKFVNDHEQIINTRFKPLVRILQKQMADKPDISENELLKDLKLYASERLKYQLAENASIAQRIKENLNSKDKQLVQKYIDEVNSKFLKVSDYKQFPYREYSDLLKNSIYLVNDSSFKGVYGTKFKETIRKRYIKQTILYPFKDTIEKVGSPMKVVVQDMIKGSVATLDHLMPKNRDGWDSLPNYTVMCKNCNQEKTNYSFSHWFELHPNIGKNMQKYADRIIELVNKGELGPEYEKYPYVLAKGLNILSGGRIILRFKKNTNNRENKNV